MVARTRIRAMLVVAVVAASAGLVGCVERPVSGGFDCCDEDGLVYQSDYGAFEAWRDLPDRPVFSDDALPEFVTLNSLDEPFNTIGQDQRSFVGIADNLAAIGRDRVGDGRYFIEGQTQKIVVIYFDNNASPTADALGPALDVRMSVTLPTEIDDRGGAVGATIRSSNAQPQAVYSAARLLSNAPLSISAVQDSALIHRPGHAATPISTDELLGDGVLLGCDALDGQVASDPSCSGFVTLRVTALPLDFAVSTALHPPGSDGWIAVSVMTRQEKHRVLTLAPGDPSALRLEYSHIGNLGANDVTVSVHLDPGLEITGSTLARSAGTEVSIPVHDNRRFDASGIQVVPSETFSLILDFRARDDGEFECGGRWLTARVTIVSGAQTFSEDHLVDVASAC